MNDAGLNAAPAADAWGNEAPLRLIGLCAAWCGVCREFEPAFRRLAAEHPRLQAAWLDVEDPDVSDALGEIDIDTFPTVAFGRGDQLLFWGAILPQPAVLQRMLADAADSHSGSDAAALAEQPHWQRLCALAFGKAA
ncbi:thioredoxin family protein [Corticibacter populi]|uniref:thioredoxin family protein n=1 Tax=Corticibacter populi TaxID=1550736 RepID=UPI0010D80E3B|nr:thioredoxin family protein [Corticibacter populi]RZS35713.1 thioredoxin [Corticibacter populi]